MRTPKYLTELVHSLEKGDFMFMTFLEQVPNQIYVINYTFLHCIGTIEHVI